MVEPAFYVMTIYRGDTYRWKLIIWQDAAKTIPADLTGVVVKAEIHQVETTVLACTVTGQEIHMVLNAEQSKALIVGDGRWDLQLIYLSGDVQTIIRGGVLIRADVAGSRAA